MELNNTKAHFAVIFPFLLICFLFFSLSCHSAHLSTEKKAAAEKENSSLNTNPSDSNKNNTSLKTSEIEITGTYELNANRSGSEKYVNTLILTRKANNIIYAAFEGNYVFTRNGAESFHETNADGNLTLKSSTATGKLMEEVTGNSCIITLNFLDNSVNLKSSNCNLRVSPDGIYKKVSDKTAQNENPENNNSEKTDNSGDADKAPKIQYDADNIPNDIVNLLAREGDSIDCGEDVLQFSGKVSDVVSPNDYIYEFTLVDDKRRRQKFSLIVSMDDNLPSKDLRAIISVGNKLEVRYLLCGNASVATPTAIYRQ